MKTAVFQNDWLKLLVATLLVWTIAGHGIAQTYTVLHQFAPASGSPFPVNTDGYGPNSLILAGDTLFGTTYYGNTNGTGTVFAIGTNGSDFRLLHTFSAMTCPCPSNFNSDGILPHALLLSGNTLYGASGGGANGSGTIFALNTNGTGFSTVYTFSGSDGGSPGYLILFGNTLYGAAYFGGNGSGTIFAVNTDGTGFTILYNFSAGGLNEQSAYTNRDGSNPNSLLLSGDRLFGTTDEGGTSGMGEVFAVNTDGTGFTILHRFTELNHGYNNDGARPRSLVLSGGTLFGATEAGTSSGAGALFSINTNGTGFKILNNSMSLEGMYSQLVSAGNVLYGINEGEVFSLNTDGSGFTILHSGIWGNVLCLVSSGNTLYGGMGDVFSLSLPIPPPKLTIVPDGSGGYLIGAQGQPDFTYKLQRAASLTGPWATSAPQTADSSGLIEFHDLFPVPGGAFYRTVQP